MSESLLWGDARDARLLELNREGYTPAEIARDMATVDIIVTPSSVRKRLQQLRADAKAARVYWTPERNTKLADLWNREPRMRLVDIREELGAGCSVANISLQARALGLTPRFVKVSAGRRPPSIDPPAKPAPKFMPLEAPCPFYLGHGESCGLMVNRRPDAHGNRPSQYCETHRSHVVPLSRGSIGTLATYAKGHRFG